VVSTIGRKGGKEKKTNLGGGAMPRDAKKRKKTKIEARAEKRCFHSSMYLFAGGIKKGERVRGRPKQKEKKGTSGDVTHCSPSHCPRYETL